MKTKFTSLTTALTLAIWLSLIYVSSVSAVVPGKFGDALEFDGVDDYVMVPDSPSLRIPSTEVTIEAWVWFASNSTGTQLIIRKWLDSGGGSLSYVLGTIDSKIYGAVEEQGLKHFPTWTTNQTISDLGVNDTWVHVAFTWKKENITGDDGNIFVNGLAVNTTFTPQGYSENFTIGYNAYPLYFARKAESLLSDYFKGGLDEVRISNVSRTTFNLTSAPTADTNTIALWHFDEGAGSIVYDASPNANNGTIYGATWTGVIPEFSSPIVLLLLIIGVSLIIGIQRIGYGKKRVRLCSGSTDRTI